MDPRSAMTALLATAVLSVLSSPVTHVGAAPSVIPTATPSMSPDDVFYAIRRVFRSHRPPPPYITYTMVRQNNDAEGYPDYATSYTYHIWCRTSDKAALARKISRLGSIGPLEFQRPLFNEDEDPGPPTADLFEPAPVHSHPITWVPTPEPTGTLPPVIASVQVNANLDYYVVSVGMDSGLLHVVLTPRRDPERNRLRELWVDPKTYELVKVIATDRLFVEGEGMRTEIYPVLFTITMAHLDGVPIVTHIRGVVQGDYTGDDQIVEYSYEDITFPKELPDWYFDPRDYASHTNDAPS